MAAPIGREPSEREASRLCRCGACLARDNPGPLCAACARQAQQARLEPPKLPPESWQAEPLRGVLAGRHMGRIVRAWRHYGPRPLSQELVAGWLGITQTQLSRVETGPPVRDLERLIRWARILSIPAEQLWFDLPGEEPGGHGGGDRFGGELLGHGAWTQESTALLLDALQRADLAAMPVLASRLAHEWLLAEPPQVVEVRSGRRIGVDLIGKIERRVAHLRHMDDFIGGGDLYQLVERELRATVRLLSQAAYSEQLGKRLLGAVADAGHEAAAGRYYVAGIQAAHAAGDRAMAANLISLLGYLHSNAGTAHQRREAVLLAQTALAGAGRRVTATCRALLCERVAWAHARVGDLRRTERALGEADRAFERRRPADDPGWVYWLDRDEVDVMAGRCYTELEQPRRAEPLLRGALGHYDERRARETVLYRSWLAQGYVQAGELEEAARQSSRALLVAAGVNSARGNGRVRFLRQQLLPYRAVPAVREFEELFQELAGR
jgi:transcriptional regulator with XRE-family HTH domain